MIRLKWYCTLVVRVLIQSKKEAQMPLDPISDFEKAYIMVYAIVAGMFFAFLCGSAYSIHPTLNGSPWHMFLGIILLLLKIVLFVLSFINLIFGLITAAYTWRQGFWKCLETTARAFLVSNIISLLYLMGIQEFDPEEFVFEKNPELERKIKGA